MKDPTPAATVPALCDQSALTVRDEIAHGSLNPEALVQSCLDRIDSLNPSLNAVVTLDREGALRSAREAGRAVEQGAPTGALHGLPILVKDLSETRGLRTTYGSRCYASYIPDDDSAVVSRLRDAGAIILGKTNTPEFGAGATTTNEVFGTTGNPFNPALTPGGSSGGSAAALACGMAPLATGSDLGGSLRIPASFCSVYGFRPTPGRVPHLRHSAGFSPLWTDGPMARCVDDLAMCFDVMRHYNACDPLAFPQSDKASLSGEPVNLNRLRVGFSQDLSLAATEQGIRQTFNDRVSQLSGMFGSVETDAVSVPEAATVFTTLRAQNLYSAHATKLDLADSPLGRNVRANLELARTLTQHDVAMADNQHTLLFRDFQSYFQHYDLLICPAASVSPFPIELEHPTQIDGQLMDNYYAWYAVTWALSLTGCPIVSIPCGRDHSGMPFGLQLIAPRYQDDWLLRCSKSIEERLQVLGIGRQIPRPLPQPASA